MRLPAPAPKAYPGVAQVVVLNDAPLELRFNVLAHAILVCLPRPDVHRAFIQAVLDSLGDAYPPVKDA